MARFLFAGFSPESAATCLAGLELRGHEGYAARDGAELRELLRKQKWDLLTLSFAPEDDWVGIFLAELRGHARTAELPVLAVIPALQMNQIEEIFRLGVTECVTRPFRVGALLDKMQAVMEGEPQAVATPRKAELPDVIERTMQALIDDGRRLGDVSEISNGVQAHDPKARRLTCPSTDWTPAVAEEAVTPFHLGEEREFFLMRKDLMARLPRQEEYDCPEKVLLKKTLNPICAAVDRQQLIFTHGLYGIQTVKGFSSAYLCALLNSRYGQFYFSRYRPPAEGLKGVYLSRGDLEAMPLRIPSPKEQKPVEQIVQRLSILLPGSTNSAKLIERGKLLGELNRTIFSQLGFNDDAVRTLTELHY